LQFALTTHPSQQVLYLIHLQDLTLVVLPL